MVEAVAGARLAGTPASRAVLLDQIRMRARVIASLFWALREHPLDHHLGLTSGGTLGSASDGGAARLARARRCSRSTVTIATLATAALTRLQQHGERLRSGIGVDDKQQSLRCPTAKRARQRRYLTLQIGRHLLPAGLVQA